MTTFTAAILGFAANAKIKERAILEGCAFQVLAAAQAASPVDTGKFRADWAALETGESWAVVNTVEYAPALEEGRSKQAPNGIFYEIRAAWPAVVAAETIKVGWI